jgi:peptidoglycan hydrolase-like protein with peptidoglycan-binding domain
MRRIRGRLATSILIALLVPVASAGAATTTTAAKAKTVAAKAITKQVKGSMKLYLPDAFFVNRDAVIVPNRAIHVRGVVWPYVRGQKVTLKASIGSHVIGTVHSWIYPSKNGRYGKFTESFRTSMTGDVTVAAAHAKTATMKGFGTERHYSVLSESVGFGSTGPFVQLIQQRLAALHFYIPQTGVYDQGTGLAVDAYHRLLGWGVYQTLDARTIQYLLNGWGQFKVRFPSQGQHAEGDLSDQLLALINGSKVYAIYPISSGKPSTPTVLGEFRVYSKVPGYLPDGMYFSNFFTGGYAIHGYNPAPDYPASHGCMRLPIVDAISVYNWLQIGNGVDTYYG